MIDTCCLYPPGVEKLEVRRWARRHLEVHIEQAVNGNESQNLAVAGTYIRK